MERNLVGSLERRRRKRRLLLLGFLAALAALILYAVTRPSEKEQEASQLRKDMVNMMMAGGGGAGQIMDVFSGSSGGGTIDPRKLKELQAAMGKMNETERRQLVRDSLKTYLDVARKEAVKLNPKQQQEMIQKMVLDVRGRFSGMSPKQREEAGKALSTKEGKRQLQENLNFYFNDFSAKEQEAMLPLVREVLINIDSL